MDNPVCCATANRRAAGGLGFSLKCFSSRETCSGVKRGLGASLPSSQTKLHPTGLVMVATSYIGLQEFGVARVAIRVNCLAVPELASINYNYLLTESLGARLAQVVIGLN